MLEVLLSPPVVGKNLGVGDEPDQGAVFLLGDLSSLFLTLLAAREEPALELAVAIADDLELGRQGVDGLVADAVEPDRELEDVVVVLAAGVDLGNAVDQLPQWNASAVVANGHLGAVARNHDPPTVAHDELVDRVVDDLLEHHVDAVGRVRAIADAADVHTRPQPDVLEGIQRLNGLLVVDDVFLCLLVGHHFASVTPLSCAQDSTAEVVSTGLYGVIDCEHEAAHGAPL